MKITRRHVLRGIGGVVLTLPFLESLGPRHARAQQAHEPFAIFFRQANGVSTAQHSPLPSDREPERFWPAATGSLTPESLSGRALEPLTPYRSKLLVVGNVNMQHFDYGDGHARGALQALTARGPVTAGVGGDSEAAGESIDHRIGRELNPAGRDSLFLHAGHNGGWLGGACISYRGPGQRRAAEINPAAVYQRIMGSDAGLSEEAAARMAERQQSVNDLVRDQMQSLLGRTALSSSDRQRLELHFNSIRELEVSLDCRLNEQQAQALDAGSGLSSDNDYNSNGQKVLETTRLHMDVAVLAVACGYTRSVAIQVGNGNDGSTRYVDPDTGALMGENFHYISHRRASHGDDGPVIEGSDVLHYKIDLQFAQTFAHLIARLNAYDMPDGERLLDHGVAVWYNDLANGPAHGANGCPFILAGNAGGFFKQGEHVRLSGNGPNHNRLLNTIGSAVGLRNDRGEWLDDFGDPSLTPGVLSDLIA